MDGSMRSDSPGAGPQPFVGNGPAPAWNRPALHSNPLSFGSIKLGLEDCMHVDRGKTFSQERNG